MNSPTAPREQARLWLRVALAVVSVGAIGVWIGQEQLSRYLLPAPVTSAPVHFLNSADTEYPILYVGDVLYAEGAIHSLEFFEPLFGAERPTVNPTKPELETERRLRFRQPGEYYLRANHTHDTKVLVLSPDEPVSQSVTHLFDFVVANSLYCDGHDARWYQGPHEFIRWWLHSDQPSLLLCGPTHALFRRLVNDRFDLPTRIVTYPGTYWDDGEIGKKTHNIPEVYLPDQNKWVQFDVNQAFLPRWLSSMEISEFVKQHAEPGTGAIDESALARLDLHQAPTTFQARECAECSEGDVAGCVSEVPMRTSWLSNLRFYFGGAAYWGGQTNRPNGTEFLPPEFDVYFASQHADPRLERAAVEWEESFGLRVSVVPPEEMKRLLNAGHRTIIETAAWKWKLPTR